MEEESEIVTPAQSISIPSIKVTEAMKNEDSLIFIVRSTKLVDNQEQRVERTFEDFEWLQHCLFTQDEVPGLQGIIFPPLPAKPACSQPNSQGRNLKLLGFLAMGEDWRPYCLALQKYLQLVAAHSTLGINTAWHTFLTHKDLMVQVFKVKTNLTHIHPAKQQMKRGLFSRLSQAVEEKRKENHKDVDDFFQNVRDDNLTLLGLSRVAAEKFLEVVLTEQKMAMACEHFSTSLHLVIELGDPISVAFTRVCLKLSEVIAVIKRNFEIVAENNINTLGLALDLDLRYQETEREMLFRRTCKLVELENANRNVEKAKSAKKATMEEIKNAAEKEFDHISAVAKMEIEKFHRLRVEVFQQSLVQWCESQLSTARETCDLLSQQLAAFRLLTTE